MHTLLKKCIAFALFKRKPATCNHHQAQCRQRKEAEPIAKRSQDEKSGSCGEGLHILYVYIVCLIYKYITID